MAILGAGCAHIFASLASLTFRDLQLRMIIGLFRGLLVTLGLLHYRERRFKEHDYGL